MGRVGSWEQCIDQSEDRCIHSRQNVSLSARSVRHSFHSFVIFRKANYVHKTGKVYVIYMCFIGAIRWLQPFQKRNYNLPSSDSSETILICLVEAYVTRSRIELIWVYLGVKTCEVFLCFVTIYKLMFRLFTVPYFSVGFSRVERFD